MEHEDIEQVPAYIDGEEVWVTLCRCGKAFWDVDSGAAYKAWEQHEVDAF